MEYQISTKKVHWQSDIDDEMFYSVQRRSSMGIIWFTVQAKLTIDQANTLKHNLDLIAGNK